MKLTQALLAAALMLCCALPAAAEVGEAKRNLRALYVKPSATDAGIREFDDPHLVIVTRDAPTDAPLLVFLPGTGGQPANLKDLLRVVAGQGYRVIGLEYNNLPAVVETCRADLEAGCAGAMRQERIFGDDSSPQVATPAAESVVNRLTRLLEHLDRKAPQQEWGKYLRDGEPDWSRIAIGGLSQGAGMAAYLAKKKNVLRVVLFSSPWDFYGGDQKGRLAPWLAEPSATPMERWYAVYHRREGTAHIIDQAYRRLEIPPDHIRILDADLPRKIPGAKNPFHSDPVHNPVYLPVWKEMFGHWP